MKKIFCLLIMLLLLVSGCGQDSTAKDTVQTVAIPLRMRREL